MDKIEAVKLTIEMWEWLEKHPDCDKNDFFDLHPDFPVCGDCCLCEVFGCYGVAKYSSGCPLDTERLNCLNPDSPYSDWGNYLYLDSTKTAKHAHRVVLACKRWLKKGGKENADV